MKNVCLSGFLASLALLVPLATAQPTDPPPARAPVTTAPTYTPTSLAADPDLPRTSDGRPDFQGTVWMSNFFPFFDTNPFSPKLVVSEAEAKKIVDTMAAIILARPEFKLDPEAAGILNGGGLPIVRGERRTRLIVLPADGKLPILPGVIKPAAAAPPSSDYEQRSVAERCLLLSNNPPYWMTLANRFEFVQTPTYVVIHSENGDEVRIIPFAGQHRPDGPRSWHGDSIARWDGDTLVVETTRLKHSQRLRGFFTRFLVNEDATVVERFTRLSARELLYQFTVVDPKVYSAPWLGEYSLYASNTRNYPFACHEHNYSLTNTLQGQLVVDERAAASRQP